MPCVSLDACTKYKNRRPSGKKCGNRWLVWRPSIVVISRAGPPDAAIRERPRVAEPTMITPSRFHVPPRATGVSASDWEEPPAMSIRYSLLPAKNPMARLSGDQNGNAAPSVPESGCAVMALSSRSQSCDRPDCDATKTRYRPSGESAIESGSAVGGVLTSSRTSAAVSLAIAPVERGERTASTIVATATAAERAAIAHGRRFDAPTIAGARGSAL